MHGLKDATTDADEIRRWWGLFPTSNVGIATGAGLVVYDIDPGKGGGGTFESWTAGHDFPRAPTVVTGSGGLHFYFAGAERSGTNVLGPGVDVRGVGGYVVAPPSVHVSSERYYWAVEGEPAPLPSYLQPPAGGVPNVVVPHDPVKRGRRYARAAFDAELEAVRIAVDGTRNDQLNRSAFAIARFVTDGSIPASEYVERFTGTATDAGLGADEVRRTLASALGSRT
jgi:hypothetical protein